MYRADEPKHPFAVTQEHMDSVGDQNVHFPWEQRHSNLQQLISRKVGQ